MKNLSIELKKVRKKLKLSQNKFEKKYNFSSGYIFKIESGKIKVPGSNLLKRLERIILVNSEIKVKKPIIAVKKESAIKDNVKVSKKKIVKK